MATYYDGPKYKKKLCNDILIGGGGVGKTWEKPTQVERAAALVQCKT